MGTILQGACPRCGCHADLFVGGGLRDCYPEAALAAAPGDEGLAAALKQKKRFRIERRAAVCRTCRKFAVAVSVVYETVDGREKRTAGVCPDCGGALTHPASDTKEMSCPVCGQPVSFAAVGNWD